MLKKDIKKSILFCLNKPQTTSSISALLKISRKAILNHIDELKSLEMVKETISTKTTRIFRLTELGEQLIKKIR